LVWQRELRDEHAKAQERKSMEQYLLGELAMVQTALLQPRVRMRTESVLVRAEVGVQTGTLFACMEAQATRKVCSLVTQVAACWAETVALGTDVQREAQEVWKQHQQLRLAQDEVLRLREEVAAAVQRGNEAERDAERMRKQLLGRAGRFSSGRGAGERSQKAPLSRRENGLNVCSPQKPGLSRTGIDGKGRPSSPEGPGSCSREGESLAVDPQRESEVGGTGEFAALLKRARSLVARGKLVLPR